MKVHIATVAETPNSLATRDKFIELAQSDTVGRHTLEADPASADAILFIDLHVGGLDPLLTTLPAHPTYGAHMAKAFAFNGGDTPVYTLPGVYVSATPRWPRRLPVVGGPYPERIAQVPTADQEPDLLFSFRGSPTHPVREHVLAIHHDRAVIEESDVGPWGRMRVDIEFAAALMRHAKLIKRSKFVLCPRGHGPSSYRLFEALGAGRVPVVISDTWLPPPGVPWEDCAVRIAEADVRSTAARLEALEPQWEALAGAARDAAETFASTHLWDHFCESIAIVSMQPRPRRLPLWVRTQILRIRVSQARARRRARR